MLIGNADLPRHLDLPEALRPLTRLKAERLVHESFAEDAMAIARKIEATWNYLNGRETVAVWPPQLNAAPSMYDSVRMFFKQPNLKSIQVTLLLSLIIALGGLQIWLLLRTEREKHQTVVTQDNTSGAENSIPSPSGDQPLGPNAKKQITDRLITD